MLRLCLLVALAFVLVDQNLSQEAAVTTFSSTNCLTRYTSWTNHGTGHLLVLRSHHLICPYPRALTSFRLIYRSTPTFGRKIRYKYRCCKPRQSKSYTIRYTLYKPYYSGKISYLKQQLVSCSSTGGVIAGFQLRRHTSFSQRKFRYKYYCRKVRTSSCYTRYTAYDHYGENQANRLRKFPVECKDRNRHFIQSFRLQQSGPEIRYWYRCCRA